jgi:hypothetical protein
MSKVHHSHRHCSPRSKSTPTSNPIWSSSSSSEVVNTSGVVSSAPSPRVIVVSSAFTPRTTSDLQMGQVRRRVVSHGVLFICLCQKYIYIRIGGERCTCTPREIHDHMVAALPGSLHPRSPPDIPRTQSSRSRSAVRILSAMGVQWVCSAGAAASRCGEDGRGGTAAVDCWESSTL